MGCVASSLSRFDEGWDVMPGDLTLRLGKGVLGGMRGAEDFLVRTGQAVRLWSYLLSNRRPWRPGYSEYKARALYRILANSAMLDLFREGKELPGNYGVRLDARVVEVPWALSRLSPGPGMLLDAGSSLNHDHILTAPPLATKAISILTLAPEARCYWERGISYLYGDLRRTVLRDAAFDEVVCISTIEHVGMDNAMYAQEDNGRKGPVEGGYLEAVRELRRIVAPGGRLYMTFPFGRYENHGWFQQFDARMADNVLQTFTPARYQETIFEYGASGWRRSSRSSCAECSFFDVHTSRYFDPTSDVDFPPDFPAGERAVACLELWT